MPTNRQVEREKHRDPVEKSRRTYRQTEPADWAVVDMAILLKLIVNVTGCGGAVRFGYTSDGGAYAIGFYDQDDKWTEYIRPNEDVNEVISELASAWVA
jgi:hypothetical protein